MTNLEGKIAGAVVLVLVVVVVVAGAIVTISNSHSESFKDYVAELVVLASALGLAVGIAAHGRNNHKDGNDKHESDARDHDA